MFQPYGQRHLRGLVGRLPQLQVALFLKQILHQWPQQPGGACQRGDGGLGRWIVGFLDYWISGLLYGRARGRI